MLRRRLLQMMLLATLAATATAWAHNGMTHVMGTIAAISPVSLDVKTTTNKVTTVLVNASTKWMKGSDAIGPKDVKIGDRVVIHAKPVDGKLVAAEVEIGAAVHSH